MGEVVIMILQQLRKPCWWSKIYIIKLQISYSVYVPKLSKLVGSRQSYCKSKQAYFFGPPCTHVRSRRPMIERSADCRDPHG